MFDGSLFYSCHLPCEDNYEADWIMGHPDVLLSLPNGSVFLTCPKISAGRTKSRDDFSQRLQHWGSTATVSSAQARRHGCWQHQGQEELSSPAVVLG